VKQGSLYTLVYAAVLGLVCALLLSGVNTFTAGRKAANARAEEIRHILGVLGVSVAPDASSDELVQVYARDVSEEDRDGLTFYVYHDPKRGTLSAVRFSGPGLWGPVEGFLCFEADMRTIAAVSFYKEEETPGLGGEISTPAFTDQFKGLSAVGPDGRPGIAVVRGGTRGRAPNQVDAISGATMTSDKVQAMLNKVIAEVVGGANG
jgi:Na+-transporting NADH:ubiquinone oxidoreductase subunit C